MFIDEYHEKVLNLISEIYDAEKETIETAGLKVAEAIKEDNLIHVFGCGHSHMVAEELFYRAGGIVPISPIFDTSVMLHEGAQKSSSLEKMSGLAKLTLKDYKIEKGDIILIASNSGINPYPIEMATEASKKSAFVIGITSDSYNEEESRHPENLHLRDVSDITLNNHVAYGDASITISENGLKSGPLSSISLFYLANSIILAACEYLVEEDITPPIFTSGNIPDGDLKNQALIEKFKYRIKHL
jgi:uncharacterized phosphosugar-binding protein